MGSEPGRGGGRADLTPARPPAVRAEELFLRITGLKMKMEQYRLGEAFADRVVELRDIQFLNRAWQAPENLPSEMEIKTPDRWVARIEQQHSLRPALV